MFVVWLKIKKLKKDGRKQVQKMNLFLQDQVAQIQEGNVKVLDQKARKLFKHLYMSFFAPVAVRFKIDWPDAYRFVAQKLIKKYRKASAQSNADREMTEKIENEALSYLRRYIEHEPGLEEIPDWINANSINALSFFYKGDIKGYCNVWKKVEKFRCDILRKHQLEKLEIEFVPRSVAFGSIGVYESLSVYIKAGLLGLRPSKKLVLLLDPRSSVNNSCYLNYWRKYITVISDPRSIKLLALLEKSLTVPLTLYMPFHEKILMSQRSVGVVREQWIQEKRPPILTLSKEDYARGWKCLKSLGVPEDAWFVCFHVREPGWHENKNSSTENFRNADVNTYIPAIKAIIDAGGWVIRMGDSSMTALPEMPHVIDYAHSETKSDWMDVFLCAQCRFFIGTSSGLFSFAMAFGNPLVMTNFLAGQALYYFSSQDIFIPRVCRRRKESRLLNFKEMIAPPVGMFSTQYYYEKFELDVIENTPEEIKNVVEEMLMRFNGDLQYSEKDKDLQKKFKDITETCSELYEDEKVAINARMGRDFLCKYMSLLSTDDKE